MLNWCIIILFKGQSAIEYLTTYGWMLLAVGITGSAIYTTVDAGCEIEVRGSGSDLAVQDSGLTQDNAFSIIFRNTAADLIEIKSTSFDGYENSSTVEIPSGEEASYVVSEVSTTATCNEYDMSIVYDSGSLENLQQNLTVSAPFEAAQIIIQKLLASGGQIESIETIETVLPKDNATMCFGENCPSTDGGELTESEKYINISGDTMQGSLETNSFEATCYGDQCGSIKTSDDGYINTENNTMTGTLNVTEIKPIDNLCLGGTCSS